VEHTRLGLKQFEAYAWLCTHVSGLAQLIMSSYGVEDRSSFHEAYHTFVLDSCITTSLDFVAIVSFPLVLLAALHTPDGGFGSGQVRNAA
jgi:hypothetical protein